MTLKLDEALNLVRSIFAGSEIHADQNHNPASDNTTLVIMAFDESVKNETSTRELEKIRRTVQPRKSSHAAQGQSGRGTGRGSPPRTSSRAPR